MGRSSASPTTPARSTACTTSASPCCTTPAATTRRWGEVWRLSRPGTRAESSLLGFQHFSLSPFQLEAGLHAKYLDVFFIYSNPFCHLGGIFCCIRSSVVTEQAEREQLVCFTGTDVHERVMQVQCVSSEQKCHMSLTWLGRTPSLTSPPRCSPHLPG